MNRQDLEARGEILRFFESDYWKDEARDLLKESEEYKELQELFESLDNIDDAIDHYIINKMADPVGFCKKIVETKEKKEFAWRNQSTFKEQVNEITV